MAERIFSATVNGKRRQVLMTMGDDEHNDVEAGYLLMATTEAYWDRFYYGASGNDLIADLVDPKLKKPRT